MHYPVYLEDKLISISRLQKNYKKIPYDINLNFSSDKTYIKIILSLFICLILRFFYISFAVIAHFTNF